MTRELIEQLIRQSLREGTSIIVLAMPREGAPVVCTNLRDSPQVVAEIVRGWAGLLDRHAREGTVLRHSQSTEMVIQA